MERDVGTISDGVHILTDAALDRIKDDAWTKGYNRGVFEAECKARDKLREAEASGMLAVNPAPNAAPRATPYFMQSGFCPSGE